MTRYWLFLVLFEVAASAAPVRPIWKVRERDAGEPVVVTDLAGNTYIAKWSYDGDSTLTVAKRGPSGRRAWSTTLREHAFPLGIAVDAEGVYVTGTEYHHGNPTNVY